MNIWEGVRRISEATNNVARIFFFFFFFSLLFLLFFFFLLFIFFFFFFLGKEGFTDGSIHVFIQYL